MISNVKGTHDWIDLTLYNFIRDITAKHLQQYHFHEIKTPILEYTELFKRSLGTETDVVSKEMFIIQPRGQEDESICLRPEATASIMRAYLAHAIEQRPWKVFLFGQMFRYERPQKGRLREFNQASIEILGSEAIADDVQLIAMLDRLFTETFLLQNYALTINFLGNAQERQLYKEKLKIFLDAITDQLCDNCKIRKEKNILRVLDCKNQQCIQLYQQAPKITDVLGIQSAKQWQTLQDQLHLLSVSFTHNPMLVRGLDYYDKTVFEFVSHNLGAQNAFCAGGRYNRLAQELGAQQEVPALGASIGIERLAMLLEPLMQQLPLPQPPALHVILPLEEAQESIALLLADTLHAHGLTTEILFDGSIKSRMRKANKFGASYVLLIGPDEQQNNEVTIKNMMTRQEERIKQIAILEHLKK